MGFGSRKDTERYSCQLGANGGDEERKARIVILHHDFLRILDAFLSQLINWTEQRDLPEVHEWAGRALADRLQFLWTQKGDWCSENEGFNKRWMEFGDKRHARSPRSYLGWLAGDYLRKLIHERVIAGVMLSPSETEKESASFAEIAAYPKERISWLKKLVALPDFSPRISAAVGRTCLRENATGRARNLEFSGDAEMPDAR